DVLQSRDAREQIEIGRVQTVQTAGARNPVRSGDEDATERIAAGAGQQTIAQQMLVARARFANRFFVAAEGLGERRGLIAQRERAAGESAPSESEGDRTARRG